MALLNGIQQVGIGVENAEQGFSWYSKNLAADIQVFDDNNIADLMAPFMNGEANEKRAIMALNLSGGGGYELWQFTQRIPKAPKQPFQWGDLGINCIEIKCRSIQEHHHSWMKNNPQNTSPILSCSFLNNHFYTKDPYGNHIRIIESNDFFDAGHIGGVSAAIIGVSDLKASLKFYSETLGYDKVLFNEISCFEDFSWFQIENKSFKRIRLARSNYSNAGFSSLLGKSYIELLQCIDRKPNRIFEHRIWGDLGFIHLCFDTSNIEEVFKKCGDAGFPFKVKSRSDFTMEESKGHWGYVEDPDGTLIEFVETKAVPILPKLGITIKIKNKYKSKPLPIWMMKALKFKRKKF